MNALYAIWCLLPLAFLLIGLWSLLEKIGGKTKRENPGDFFKQFIFVSGCVLASVAINEYFVIPQVPALLPSFVPLLLVQITLLPFVLYIGAICIGGSKAIRIEKVAHVSQNRRRKR